MNHDFVGISSIRQTAEAHMSMAQPAVLGTQEHQAGMASLKDAAHEFESYFISNLLKVMRETVPKGALENKGGAYFYSFYDQEIGRMAAESGGLGLARMIHEYTEKNSPLPSSFHVGKPIEEPTDNNLRGSALRTRG
jgi:flagellar protein FlgJ